ncbi:hypothetical protein HDU86_006608, partial [Geranomyces michiganensis]
GVVPTPGGLQRERSTRSRPGSPTRHGAGGAAPGATSNNGGAMDGNSNAASVARQQSTRRARKDRGEQLPFISMDPYRTNVADEDGAESASRAPPKSPSTHQRSRSRSAIAIEMPPITPTTPSITTLQRRLPFPEGNNGNTSALNLADLQRIADQQSHHAKTMRDRAASGTAIEDIVPPSTNMRDRTYSERPSGEPNGKRRKDKGADGHGGRSKVAPKEV